MSEPGLSLTVDPRPIERIPAQLAAAGVFESERPLRGTAGRADWRLCGVLSDLARRGRLTGAAGEFTLVGCGGRMACERLLVLGLGPRSDFAADAFGRVVTEVFERAAALGATSLAIGSLGLEMEEWTRHTRAFVDGALAGLGPHPMDVALCLEPAEADRVRRELVQHCRGTGIVLDMPAPGHGSGASESVGRPPTAGS